MIKDKVIIHPHTGEVFYSGIKIGVLNSAERKILFCLIDKNKNSVSKDELITVGWPQRVTVSNSLNVAIKKIRGILSVINLDDLIVTVPKVGFFLENPDVFIISEHHSVLTEQGEEQAANVSNSIPRVLQKTEPVENNTEKDQLFINENNKKKDVNQLLNHSIKKNVTMNDADKLSTKILCSLVVLVVFLPMLMVHILLAISEPDITCHDVNNVTYCGVGPQDVDFENNNHNSGLYIYGVNCDDIKKTIYYRIN